MSSWRPTRMKARVGCAKMAFTICVVCIITCTTVPFDLGYLGNGPFLPTGPNNPATSSEANKVCQMVYHGKAMLTSKALICLWPTCSITKVAGFICLAMQIQDGPLYSTLQAKLHQIFSWIFFLHMSTLSTLQKTLFRDLYTEERDQWYRIVTTHMHCKMGRGGGGQRTEEKSVISLVGVLSRANPYGLYEGWEQ